MKRYVGLAGLGLLLITTPGCAGAADTHMKKMIAHINDLAVAFEKKQSKEQKKAIFEKLEESIDRFEALRLSPEQRAELKQKYGAEAELATKRLKVAIRDSGITPEADAMLKKSVEAVQKVIAENGKRPGGK